jgi:predicted nucleic acid-binding protein
MADDGSHEFLDTNVIVYAHDRSAGTKREVALELLSHLVLERKAALSVQVLQEFFVTTTLKIPAPISRDEARSIVADLSALRTHAPTSFDVLGAIDLQAKLKVSFWDAMIMRSATRLGCNVLWSEDLIPGQTYDGVVVRNPFAAS